MTEMELDTIRKNIDDLDTMIHDPKRVLQVIENVRAKAIASKLDPVIAEKDLPDHHRLFRDRGASGIEQRYEW
jgi:chorismate mutase